MKTFIVLISVYGLPSRIDCNEIENTIFYNYKETEMSSYEVLNLVFQKLHLSGVGDDISVYTLSGFMEAFNDEEINADDYFMSYVNVIDVHNVKPLDRQILINVGKCCGNGCTNCPYIPKWTKGSTKINNIK